MPASRAPAPRRAAPTQGIEQIRETQQRGLAVAKAVGTNLMNNYRDWFTPLLPEHMPVDAYLTLLYGALRKDTDMARAAQVNFQSLLIAATECAQLGGIPGKNYHFLTFTDQETQWPTITGVTDYKLEIQLALNVTDEYDTIEVECVYRGDHFYWKPGMNLPEHEFRDEVRDHHDLRAVYAYPAKDDRRVGKFILMYRAEVMLHRARARSKKLWDDPLAEPFMWYKTAVHKGRRFWKQSAEKQAPAHAAQAAALRMGGTMMQLSQDEPPVLVPPLRGQIANGAPAGGPDDDVPDGDMISTVTVENEDLGGWPEGSTTERPAAAEPADDTPAREGPADKDGPVTDTTRETLLDLVTSTGWEGAHDPGRVHAVLGVLAVGKQGQAPIRVTSVTRMTERQALIASARLRDMLANQPAGKTLAEVLDGLYAAVTAKESTVTPPDPPADPLRELAALLQQAGLHPKRDSGKITELACSFAGRELGTANDLTSEEATAMALEVRAALDSGDPLVHLAAKSAEWERAWEDTDPDGYKAFDAGRPTA
jgi:RecT family protein